MKSFLTRHFALIIIALMALCLRLYKFSSPILDWHSFRQADTASVSREYVKHGIDIVHPKYHDLANIQSGKDNLDGYRMVEFPVINAVVALIVTSSPFLSIEAVHRIISIVSSLATLISLFFLTKKISGVRVAYVTVITFALLPYSVYYSRTILPEPILLFFFIFSLYNFVVWIKHKKIMSYFIALLSLAVALLLKPFVLFFFPVFVVLAYTNKGIKIYKNWLLYPFFIVCILPLLWWRNWIQQFPSGIPASDWLFNNQNPQLSGVIANNPILHLLYKLFGYNEEGIRYRPAWIRWLAYERVTKLILGYSSLVFLPLAFYKIKKKELLVYGVWWASALLYMIVIARGNVQHDYYQVLLLPILCMTLGRGIIMFEAIISKKFSPVIGLSTVTVIFLTGLLFSWNQVKGYYAINHPEYITAGNAVDRQTPTDAKVIAPAFGDTMFLYQTNRTGWPIGYDIEKKIASGATHYVSTSYDEEARALEDTYFTIEKTPEYILIDLTKKRNDSE